MTSVTAATSSQSQASDTSTQTSKWSWTQPDVSYHPDREKWEQRTAKRLAEDPSLTSTPLPEGFPKKAESPLVWEGKDWKNEAQWVFTLSEEHLKEIAVAVKHYHGLGLHFGHISPKTFPLPTLGPILTSLSQELHYGRGFAVVRTIPVSSYSKEDNILIYVGISSYIGATRGLQDANGGVLSHIKDLSSSFRAGQIGGPAYTTDKQVFHTDMGADIVSLFALEIAKEGGISRISSSWRVYNELAEKRPDLVKVLSEDWAVDEWGRDPPYSNRPLLYYLDEKIIIQYARRYFTGFQGLPRSKDIPPITEAQAEALDALHFLAEKYSLGLNFQKGDIQYINNLSVFHARDGFKDDEKQRRHLLRLWQRNEELAWKLPEPLKPLWKKTYDVTPEEQTFAVNPVIRDAVKGKN
ncbi:taurine catabolism dioxygenase TauD [Gymnopilus junonius]|uniref:Taurine catabolism dioxygenase TauD n=1 Tax=Gymnopilus junonius TaxID=109634 RepID=A0A9P5TGK5_GYMJU|nr:taurine catabolism dioxygenase TauD [Gymnopilus junonius]